MHKKITDTEQNEQTVNTEAASQAADTPSAEGKGKKRSRKRNRRKWLLILIPVLLVAGLAAFLIVCRSKQKITESAVDSKNIETVRRGDIRNELTSSGTLLPKDTYTITSLVSGEIMAADFEEGDQVEKGDVLFVLDQSEVEGDIASAERSLATAQTNYDEAASDNALALSKLNGGTYTAKESGYVTNLTLKAGDTVGGQNSTTIAELYNDDAMYVRIPFLTGDADMLGIGQDILVEFSDTGELIPGRVEEKSQLEETMDGGTLVKYVKILVTNPGGITTSDRATAYAGDIYSAGDGQFEPYKTENLKVDLPSSVKVAQVLVSEGQYISPGTPLFTMTSETLNDAVRSAQKTLTSAENSLIDAQDKITRLDDSLDKYTITAPISGQVIKKYMKTGDKVANSNNSTSLALIYDLSELTFEMSIDELDISSIRVGQEVVVTADAFEGKEFSAHVTNVGLDGTTSNGVTTYPVVVTLDEMEGLLPGMNVNGVIILEESEDTLYIPSNALQRGNIVYVSDSSQSADTGAGQSANAGGREKPEGGKDSGKASGSAEEASGSGKGSGSGSSSGSSSGRGTGQNSSADANAPAGFHAVRVETGIVSDDYVEILSGLNEGDEVYVKDSVVTGNQWGGFGQGGPGGMPGGQGGNQRGGQGGNRPGGGF
ncbi:MAG: HlyD family efflux transporter periplasmic adaptor subunit [Lachnospiraceae bacterium]|nr:HlyD family efflux transporter periplasmic adaptor subunit [Lachnospiraceae bacterium]